MRYYLHIDPRALSDDEWCRVWAGLKWIREMEAKTNK